MSIIRRKASFSPDQVFPAIELLERRSMMSVAVNQNFWSDFAGNDQHTGIASVAAQNLQSIHWETAVDQNPQILGGELLAHYGSPVITSNNTVIVPVKTGADGGFILKAFDGASGELKWTLATDFIPAPGFSAATFSPVITRAGRLYYPGAGGTIYYCDHIDASQTPVPHQLSFYGNRNYTTERSAYDSSVYIDTPLTVSSSGVVFFGYQVTGSNPLNLQGGIARMSAVGHGIYQYASIASGNPIDTKVVHDCAPAISNDGKYVYVAVNYDSFFGGAIVRGAGSYLLCLDAASLRTVGKAFLTDPLDGQPAATPDAATSSPTIGPDGDVYFGVLESSFGSNNDRGWLLHFNSTLSVSKTPGAFGWDESVSIVPSSMVKNYHGKSSYLIMSKYNNYAGLGSGNGLNKMAVLDPSSSQTDPATKVKVLKEVETVLGVTPDPAWTSQFPTAVKEWCVNTVSIDPATDSAFFNSEDGKLYRWNLGTDTLVQSIRLTPGFSEAYTPTAIGPDGTIYAMQDGILFAVGAKR